MENPTLPTNWLAALSNANHDGTTQQIDDAVGNFETENQVFLQKAQVVHQARFPGGFANAKNGLLASEKMDGVIGNNLLQRFNQEKMDGVIGNNLLQRFNQVWDFSNSTLYLTANNRLYSPFYGFLLQKRKK